MPKLKCLHINMGLLGIIKGESLAIIKPFNVSLIPQEFSRRTVCIYYNQLISYSIFNDIFVHSFSYHHGSIQLQFKNKLELRRSGS